MSLIKPKAPRWYRDENGVVEACYQVPAKSRAVLMRFGHSGMKNATLREARELGLLPSVTSILRVMAQPGLERYKLGQVIYSAMTLPRLPGEMEDAFAERIVEDSEAQAAKAAEFGTRIHDEIALIMEKAHQGQRWGAAAAIGAFTDEEIAPYLNEFIAWAYDNIEEVHAVEKVVGGKHCGYAGRLDLDCTLRGVGRCVVDFKSQGIKEGKPPTFWPDWCGQLAAYKKALNDYDPRIMSLVIDSRAPGPVWPKLWEPTEVIKGKLMFRSCFELWKALNDYDPMSAGLIRLDPTAGVKQAREDYADRQMGLNPRSI